MLIGVVAQPPQDALGAVRRGGLGPQGTPGDRTGGLSVSAGVRVGEPGRGVPREGGARADAGEQGGRRGVDPPDASVGRGEEEGPRRGLQGGTHRPRGGLLGRGPGVSPHVPERRASWARVPLTLSSPLRYPFAP
ncbi:hypothetical protein SMD44_08505 [Streptomyces alboflavus]|uniref:Uncharacterized protein n=1 Tax=Streptomyces alboflavus TaxID=67267 RepID=A0A1Z1WRF3_9ACTN|nr:hypothetical protein SMD44_08505 [Streptomyces alboflavus]